MVRMVRQPFLMLAVTVCALGFARLEGFLQVSSGGGEKAKQFTGLQKWALALDLWHRHGSIESLEAE